MKQSALPETHREGDTSHYHDSVIQVMGLPLSDDMNHNIANISTGKKQLEKWAKDNFVEVVGWSHIYSKDSGIHHLRLTMHGKMLRPELAYKGSYPVFEHEREGYVAIN